MSTEVALRALALCVVLAGTETLHGIARTVLLVPRIGKERALRWSIVSGSLLAWCVCWLLVPGVGLRGTLPHLALGLALSAFMAGFDLAMGRWVMRRPWRKALADFDPRTGNLLVVGLGLLAGFPATVHLLRSGGG